MAGFSFEEDDDAGFSDDLEFGGFSALKQLQ